jgi:hypothetical protein
MKFSVTAKYALLAVLVCALQGCGTYHYGGKSYSSAEEALEAQKLQISERLEGVTKNSPYVGGKAFFFIPPRDVIKAKGIRAIGLRAGSAKEKMVPFLENDFLTIPEVVKKGEFFDVVVVGRDLSEIQSENPDYVITLETADKEWRWDMYRADNPGNKIPVRADTTKTGVDRVNSFNDSVSKALISLGAGASK